MTTNDPALPPPVPRPFPKERRLRRRGDFVRLQPTRTRVHTPHFLLLLGQGPQPSAAARLGVTVTRKVGGAVERNRVKRLVREMFRLWPDLLPAGVDLVVVAKDGSPTLGLADVQREVREVLPLLQRRAREALRGELRRGETPRVTGR
jgi:ribonuclease P protein component